MCYKYTIIENVIRTCIKYLFVSRYFEAIYIYLMVQSKRYKFIVREALISTVRKLSEDRSEYETSLLPLLLLL